MPMNTQGRPTRAATAASGEMQTYSGNRGLDHEEPLLFEIGSLQRTGVDIAEPKGGKSRLGGLERTEPIGLPGLSEPEAMRHYVRLSPQELRDRQRALSARLVHDEAQPAPQREDGAAAGLRRHASPAAAATVQGAIALMEILAGYLMELTGRKWITLSPKAGAHGELAGMLAIKAAHEAKGSKRNIVLVPDSAHGTNPATAAFMGYHVKSVAARDNGTVSVEAVKAALSPDVAAIMLTNPNTCGLFEPQVIDIATRRCTRPVPTSTATAPTSTPSSARCAPATSASTPCTSTCTRPSRPRMAAADRVPVRLCSPRRSRPMRRFPTSCARASFRLRRDQPRRQAAGRQPFGRLTAFHGQMGMFVRALAYMLSHGADGMRQASEDAVLAANYVRACLRDVMSQPFGDKPCMHEVLFDDAWLKDTGVTTLDFAKAMIDEGYHPMTMYFPLVVHGAMLIEPTESESKYALDQFIGTLRDLAREAVESNDKRRFKEAPRFTPRRRLDETKAAREPRLRWRPPARPETAE